MLLDLFVCLIGLLAIANFASEGEFRVLFDYSKEYKGGRKIDIIISLFIWLACSIIMLCLHNPSKYLPIIVTLSVVAYMLGHKYKKEYEDGY